MKTKLTLSIDPEVIARAKEEAQRRGTSVSDMVETYLAVVSKPEPNADDEQFSPRIQALKGMIKLPPGVVLDDDPKKARQKHFEAKYLAGLK